MNKTKSINRLFLCVIVWAIVSPWLLQGVLYRMDMLQISIFGEFLFAVPVILYVIFKRISVKEWIPFRNMDLAAVLMAALAGFLLLPLVTFINACSMLFATNYVSESSSQMAKDPLWMNLLAVAVVPAVVEELVYRGIFYHAYREKGVIAGAVASAIVFGLIHRNLNQFCYAAVLGVFFCFFVEITGSIYASMTAHFVINGWNVLLQKLLAPFADATEALESSAPGTEGLLMVIFVMGVLAIGSTTLAVCVMAWMTKHCKREAHMRWCFRKHEPAQGVQRSFVTLPFVLAAVITLIYMVLIEFL